MYNLSTIYNGVASKCLPVIIIMMENNRMLDWLIDWLIDWLSSIGWLMFDLLINWFIDYLIDWLIDLIGLLFSYNISINGNDLLLPDASL